ncbi:MAG: deoxynucleoside kinase [candidate division Zixibacteria bacterium]|nr:deoxynucleoside kinase [candidate division Zixibacteria bacterium]
MAVKYIAIEGPIGVGKTTLTKMLADHYGGRMVFEHPEENPFLNEFYKDRDRYAFQVQLFFLLSRFKQQQEFFSGELLATHVISDYYFGKDRIFATLTLSPDELAMYDHVASMLEKNIPLPDLIIYLTASPDILMQRVKNRGRGYEKFMDIDYLASLSEAYSKYFFHYNQTPLLVVNTENVNFATEPDLFEYLIDEINNLKPGTSYLVPTRAE